MYSDARKLHLLDEVMKINNEATLLKIESFIKTSAGTKKGKESFKDLAGIWTREEADEIQRIIDDSCENIHPEDWK